MTVASRAILMGGLICAAVFLAIVALRPAPSSSEASSVTFSDSTLGLTLAYDPDEFTVAADEASDYQTGSALIDMLSSNGNPPPVRSTFLLDEAPYDGTNLFGAWVHLSSFSRISENDTALSCNLARYGTGTVELTETKEIGGVTWYYGVIGEAAAGTSFERRVYHAMHDGNCVELAAIVATGNIGNWDPGSIQAVDEAAVFATLEGLITTARLE
ncbi:hypothetical protein HYS28_00765 [Candidatus Uhrbacteria bacterium]|nr:hypothetical protein [Candidatus Uhrbacteria bacterium]